MGSGGKVLRPERLKLQPYSVRRERLAPVEEMMGQTLHLGAPTVIESAAERTPYAAIFEDDGKVGYFYGLDTRLGDQVLDAVHVYNVCSILDHPTSDLDVHLPCDVQILWSETQDRVALVLNGRPHAVLIRGEARLLPLQLPGGVELE